MGEEVVTGKLVEVDNTFPTGSIDSVIFSIPYLDGGLDQGNICITTTANDNNSVASEVLTLHASDGLTDSALMDYQQVTQQFCTELHGYDGQISISQVITDLSGNITTNLSDNYYVEKNDAPVFSTQLPEKINLRVNQGEVTLVELSDVSDPEGHEFTLSGDTAIDTSQSAGSYALMAVATDQYGAESTKSMTVELSKNAAPTASITVSSENLWEDDWLYNGKVRDDNVEVLIGLSSNDSDGSIESSTLRAEFGWGFEEIKDYSSFYKAGVLFFGGETFRFEYQVTDNDGAVSEVAYLEFDIHKNMPPIYQGQISYSIFIGECINIEQIASDPENDEIFRYSIEGGDWQPCFNTAGNHSLKLWVTDKFGLRSEDVVINVNVEGCGNDLVWFEGSCQPKDTRPDAFQFLSWQIPGGSGPSYYYTNIMAITGINSEVDVNIEYGSYEINGSTPAKYGSYRSLPSKLSNGDTIRVRVDMNHAGKYMKLTIGDFSTQFLIEDYGA